MNKLRAVIVDDEKIAREVLESYLKSYCNEKIEIIAICDGFESAVKTLRKETVDLVFLDIQMPGMTGFEVLEHLHSLSCHSFCRILSASCLFLM